MEKKNNLGTVLFITLIIMLIILFVLVIIFTNMNRGLFNPIGLEVSDVKSFSQGESVLYNGDGDAPKELKEILKLRCKARTKTEGSTAHVSFTITTNNDLTYEITDLGCLNQTNITFPDGRVEEYYCYG